MKEICRTYVRHMLGGWGRGVHLPGSARPPMKASLVMRASMSSVWGVSHRRMMPSPDFFIPSHLMSYACPKACGKTNMSTYFKHMRNTFCTYAKTNLSEFVLPGPTGGAHGVCAVGSEIEAVQTNGVRAEVEAEALLDLLVGGVHLVSQESHDCCVCCTKNIRKMFQNKTKQQKQNTPVVFLLMSQYVAHGSAAWSGTANAAAWGALVSRW